MNPENQKEDSNGSEWKSFVDANSDICTPEEGKRWIEFLQGTEWPVKPIRKSYTEPRKCTNLPLSGQKKTIMDSFKVVPP